MAAALQTGDLDQIAAALQALHAALSADQRAELAALERAVDLARFGNRSLDAATVARARLLEGIA